ncbi:MAG: hypothetical protein K8Q91_02650 [Candidatus Vogelbacteria bacterium]|nr:hypothetical protein [Candidatus Vogelbacteria bacterium]
MADLVKEMGLNLCFSDLWHIPLRFRRGDGGGHHRLYSHSHQARGAEGIIAQLLLQPQGDVFDMTFVEVSLEDLGFDKDDKSMSLQDVYSRGLEMGLLECPYTIIPILGICGYQTTYHQPVLVATEGVVTNWYGEHHFYVLEHWSKDRGISGKTRVCYSSVEPEMSVKEELLYCCHSEEICWKVLFRLPEGQPANGRSLTAVDLERQSLPAKLDLSLTQLQFTSQAGGDLLSHLFGGKREAFPCLR